MKKLTLLLAAAMLSSMSFAAEGVYKTALFGSSYNSEGVQNYTSTWSATNDGFTVDIVNANNNKNEWEYIKMGRKKTASVGTITTHVAIDEAIKKVVLTIDAVTAKSINSVTLKTSPDSITWTEAGSFAVAQGEQAVVLATPTANLYYQVVADCQAGSSNGLITISKVEYYIAGAEVPATAIALNATTWTAEQYKYTQLTATLTPAEATTKVVWTSSDENVATVVNGNVTAVGVGTANIIATAGVGVADTCAVTVTDPTILTCDSAATLALSVSKDNELYADGKYVVRGYVTEVAYAYSEKYGNLSVWLADTKTGKNTIEAYKAVPVSEVEQTLEVGDYVEVVGDLTKFNDKNNNTIPELAAGCSIKKLAEPTTAIDNTALRTPSVKTIENGQLVIIRDGVKYNAMGVRLQ